MKSKAERAAITLKNEAIKKLNDYYEYHQEVIEGYLRLRDEANKAGSTLTKIRINKCREMEAKRGLGK